MLVCIRLTAWYAGVGVCGCDVWMNRCSRGISPSPRCEWKGAAGVSPPHLCSVWNGAAGVSPPHPHMVQLGYLPLTTLQCIPDGGGRRIGIDWTSIRHFRVGSMSGRRWSGCLCYVGSGCTYVFLYLYMVYVYVMQCLVCMKLNTWPHEFIHLVHQPYLTNPNHSASSPLPTTFYLKNKLPPPISRYCMFLYTAPHLNNLLCTPGVFMPHVLCTDIPRFVTTNKIPSNLGGRGS